MQWWGLSGQMIPRAMPRVAHLTESPLRDMSRVMTQTKNRYPGPSGWALGTGLMTPPHKTNHMLRNLKEICQTEIPALLDRCVIFCQNVSTKYCFPLHFQNKIPCLSVGLLMICYVLSASCKTVYR